MLNIGGAELLIILLVALIFLGPERLPGVARQIGQTVSGLRSLATGFQDEMAAAAKGASDDASSMTLDGPTDQADAIRATQTDPTALATAARQVHYDDDEPDVNDGGPVDLRDEEE